MTAKKTPTHQEIMQRLQEPFPPEQVRSKPQGGKKVPYAEVWSYQQCLDDVIGFGWEAVTIRLEEGDCLCKLTLTLPDGAQITREAYGEKNSAFGGAEAQAFKRACSAFGVGRYLYALDCAPPRQAQPEQNRNGRQPAPARGGQDRIGKDADKVATAAQMKKFDRLGKAYYGGGWTEKKKELINHMTLGNPPLKRNEAAELIAGLEKRAEERNAGIEPEIDFQ